MVSIVSEGSYYGSLSFGGSMEDKIIQWHKVLFSYEGQVQPVIDIKEFEVSIGQTVFIYGPSGSGKTTFLELLSGVLSCSRGEISIGGVSLSKMRSSERDRFRAENIGYIFQTFNLLSYLTVRENIELPERLAGRSSFVTSELVEPLGLSALLDRPVNQLSVGQQQRVAVARALLRKPKILLADEPTSSLDFDNRENFLKVLFRLAKEANTTVLFVSHDRSLQNLFERTIDFTEINQAARGAGC